MYDLVTRMEGKATTLASSVLGKERYQSESASENVSEGQYNSAYQRVQDVQGNMGYSKLFIK